MASRVFEADDDGFRAIAVGPEIRAALAEIAEKAKGIAEGIAAGIRSDDDEPGHVHYADSFSVGEGTVRWDGEYPGPRAVAIMQNTAPHAAAVEYGYKGRSEAKSRSAHRVLGRTLDQLDGEASG